MAIDEELLRPSREYLASLKGKIADLEAETMEKVGWYPDDQERTRELWHQFSMSVLPIRREIEAIGKVIADYYTLQPAPPPQVIPSGQ